MNCNVCKKRYKCSFEQAMFVNYIISYQMHKRNHNEAEYEQDILKSVEERFHRDLRELRRLVKIWRDHQSSVQKDNSETALLIQYAEYIQRVNNFDRLKGLFYVKTIKYEQDTKGIKEEKELFLGISFLDQKDWKVSFNKNFVKKLKFLPQDSIFQIFLKLYMAGEGLIPYTEGKNGTFKAFQRASKHQIRYFTLEIALQSNIHYLLITLGTHRIPHFEFNNANGNKIDYFSFLMMITVEDLIHKQKKQNEKMMRVTIDDIQDYYDQNPRLSYSKEELIMEKELMSQKLVYYHSKKRDNQKLGAKIFPTIYKKCAINELQLSNFAFLMEKFADYEKRVSFLERKNKNQQQLQTQVHQFIQVQDERLNKMIEVLQTQAIKSEKFEFSNHSKLVENLQKIPNFKYALTRQQRQLLATNGNLIVVGRSGTGKTTCAMLRLYGIQFLIKTNEFNSLKRQGKISITKQKCLLMHLEEFKLMRNVFLTFSGILINQIKRQYQDIKSHIKQKHAESCSICILRIKSYEQTYQQEDIIDKIRRLEQQQEKNVVSLHTISNQDFPGFFTIQNFIRIIDKTVPRPFFSHKEQHTNAKSNKSIIKHAYVNRYNFTAQDIILMKTVKAVYVDYSFFLKHIWESLPKQLVKPSKQFYLLTPVIVWSEIFSLLKGSLKAYLCPAGYISFKMYVQDNQSIFQKQPEKVFEYKKMTYNILKSYMNWCRQQDAYDLMDVVNHNLRQIELYGYSGPKINYMFVDEVQDLTASTTFLISKMVLNNIFYCGDTAQAITKGVSFRFEDLKYIFNQEYCKNALKLPLPEDIIYLTVNFRSHHFILQLANSVVSSIQALFPHSIGKIKKEKSDLMGPKPFVLINQHIQVLFQLICGPKSQQEKKQKYIFNPNNLKETDLKKETNKSQIKDRKKTKRDFFATEKDYQDYEKEDNIESRFNNEQVIIVRNLQQKYKLPKQFRKSLVLIPQTAKGLQYDQIILYNFFSSCPLYDKWQILLSHLEAEQVYQDEKTFELELSRRSKQEKNIDVQLTQEIKIMLGYYPQRKQYKIWNVKGRQSLKGVNINLFLEIGTQLKILYTAITRARSTFTIFDQKMPKNLLKFWEKLELITIIDKDNVSKYYKQKHQYVSQTQKHKKYEKPQIHWYNAGAKMLARKDYENAKVCFGNIPRVDLVERIIALQLQNEAENQLYKIKILVKNAEQLSRIERNIAKIRAEKQRQCVLKKFINAGYIYEKYSRHKDAAEAFFKAQRYESSLKFYKILKDSEKMAVCCRKLNNYRMAIEIYKQLDDIDNLIECYIQLKEWNELYSLIMQNTVYFGKMDRLKHVAFECIKNVLLSQFTKAQKFYIQFYENPQLKQIKLENDYNKDDASCHIDKMIHYYGNRNNKINKCILKEQLLKIDVEESLYKQEKQDLKQLKQRLSLIQREKQSVANQKGILSEQLARIRDNILRQEQKYPEEQLCPNSVYKQLQIRFDDVQQKRFSSYSRFQYLQKEQTQIALEIKDTQNRLKKSLDGVTKNQSIKIKIQRYVDELSKLPQLNMQQLQENGICQNFNAYAALINKQGSFLYYGQQNRYRDIGGIQMLLNGKKNLLKNVVKMVSLSANLIPTETEIAYNTFHHKYIEKKLFELIRQQIDAEKYHLIDTLKKLMVVGQNKSCLLLCNVYPQFTCLSPRFILGYLLDFSQNFIQNRFYKEEKFQYVQKPSNDEQAKRKKQSDEIQKMISALNKNALLYKIPRLLFENIYYNESIASQLTFGLILQGYINNVYAFCKRGAACKLAYLYSNYPKLVDTVKSIAFQLRISKKINEKFLFTTEERIFDKHPEAKVLHAFTIQNIFYLYDQCQDEPFLSKKVDIDKFDVEVQQLKRFEETGIDGKIQDMKRISDQNKLQIKKLIQQNNHFNSLLKQNIKEQKVLDRFYQIEYQKYSKQKESLRRQLQELSDILKKIQSQRQVAIFEKSKKTIPKKQKQRYQQTLEHLLFQVLQQQDQINKFKLEAKRMKLEKKYKSLMEAESEGFSNLQRVDTRINNQKRKIANIRKSLEDINTDIQRKSIFVKSPQENKQLYQNYIQHNQRLMNEFQLKIPRQHEIPNQKIRRQKILKILIRQYQQDKYKKHQKRISQQIMEMIENQCHIPQKSYYQFLRRYVKGQLNKTYQINFSIKIFKEVYCQIFEDADQLEANWKSNLKSHQQYIKDVRICNIIIFYLSYIFNRSIRQNIDDNIRIATQKYDDHFQERNQFEQKIISLKNKIEFCDHKLSISQLRNYQYKYQRKVAIAQLIETQIMLKQCEGFSKQPLQSLKKFLEKMLKIVKVLDTSQIAFVQLLFGFFQCRIIKQCQMLNFLADEYVLVKHNSIIIHRLKTERKGIFAYYFDRDSQVILCKMQDIQAIINAYIIQRHESVFNYGQAREISNLNQNKRFINRQLLGYSKPQSEQQASERLKLECLIHPGESKNIERIYNDYKQNSLVKQIKQSKQKILEYYLRKCHTNADAYFFVHHQIKEYSYLEACLKSIKQFNYELLKQIQSKKKSLKTEYQTYLKT